MDLLSAITANIKELKDFLLSYRIFVIAFFVGLGGVFFLTLPDNLLDIFHVKDLRDTYIEVIGALSFFSLFVAFSGFVYYVGAWVWELGRGKYRSRKREQGEIEVLKRLTIVECAYLAKYMSKQTQTAYFAPSDGVVGGLESKGILYRSAHLGRVHEFAYNIQPWAYEQLRKNPQILTNKLAESQEFREILET